jgi:hypothetical protein
LIMWLMVVNLAGVSPLAFPTLIQWEQQV